MSSIPVALQLWSLRERTKTDFAVAGERSVVEVEQLNHDPLESVRRSCNQRRTWGRT